MSTKRIAVMTSGGDAPGVNAAIRAVTHAGHERGWEILGVRDGEDGLVTGRFFALTAGAVSGILAQGGSTLGDGATRQLGDLAAVRRASLELAREHVDGLVVIGGASAQAGALALAREGVQVVGIAATIDNDLAGIDIALGVDTALGTAIESIDHLAVASSEPLVSVVEVAGASCGYLALATGVAGGAETILVPELTTSLDTVTLRVRAALERGNSHVLVVVAQGSAIGTSALLVHLRAYLDARTSSVHAVTLADLQRGGAPSAFDRLLGSRLGHAAVNQMARGPHGVVLGLCKGRVMPAPLGEVVGRPRKLDSELMAVDQTLTC
jgi:6-phosphofructokinase 1